MQDARSLGKVLGEVKSLASGPLATNGYSGSLHERLVIERPSGERLALVLKRVRPDRDWTAFRTGDTAGREALLLDAPELAGVWSVFDCPYRAFAFEEGEIAVLMDDLTDFFFPDVDEPITVADEDLLLDALATLHAEFWNSDVLTLPWLATPAQIFGALGPRSVDVGQPPFALSDMVRDGWNSAFARLPGGIAGLLRAPSETLAKWCDGLPRALIHGDAKVANFAVLPGGRCAAIDWALTGAGPATLDLGWYLAVNAGRLARPKEEVIARYRAFLESKLAAGLPAQIWERMLQAGILCGALMLLWAKASSLESGSEKAASEWQWWVDQLGSMAGSRHLN